MTPQEHRNTILKGRQAGKSVSSVEALRQKYYTQTEAIIARIREACPELMELREGCEVAIEASPSPLHLKIIEPYRGRKNEWLMTEHMVWYENIERAKIIGHPIHLEHLLRAIRVWGETSNKCRGCRLVDGFHEFDCPANDANSIGVLWDRLLTAWLADGCKFGPRSEEVIRTIFEV